MPVARRAIECAPRDGAATVTRAILAAAADRLALELGEGPVWDAAACCLWWIDSEAGLVLRGRVVGDSVVVDERREIGQRVGSVTPAADGGLLVAGERHVLVTDPAGGLVDLIRVLPDGVASRLNDGTCDPAGRFLVGSFRYDDRTAQEQLVRIEPDRSVHPVVDGVTVSNGIGFAPDGCTMYYVDSRPGVVWAFDYDVATGAATSRRAVARTGGTPDGLAVDVDGNLWIAFFGDAQVRCLTPSGALAAVVDLPVPNVTCPEFVGPLRDRLAITTARFRLDDQARQRWPASGAMFLADVGVAGLPVAVWAGRTTS